MDDLLYLMAHAPAEPQEWFWPVVRDEPVLRAVRPTEPNELASTRVREYAKAMERHRSEYAEWGA